MREGELGTRVEVDMPRCGWMPSSSGGQIPVRRRRGESCDMKQWSCDQGEHSYVSNVILLN